MTRRKNENRPSDLNNTDIVVTEPSPEGNSGEKEKVKNPHAVALGRLGGKKGGKARAEKLTPEQRSEIARKAVQARWAKRSKP
jgi:hypothetical protein